MEGDAVIYQANVQKSNLFFCKITSSTLQKDNLLWTYVLNLSQDVYEVAFTLCSRKVYINFNNLRFA